MIDLGYSMALRAYMLIAITSLGSSAIADINKGEELFHIQCTGCHVFGEHAVGPNLCNLAGRKAGTANGYSYSKSMQAYGVIWNNDSLQRFLESPLTLVPSTKMGIIGFEDRLVRQAIAEYVITRSRSAECQQKIIPYD